MNEDLKLLYEQYKLAGNSETEEQFLEAKQQLGDEVFLNYVNTQIDLKKKDQPTEIGIQSLTTSTPQSQTELPTLPNPIPENEFTVPMGSEQDLMSASSDFTLETPSTDLPLTDVASSGTGSLPSNQTQGIAQQPTYTKPSVGAMAYPIANEEIGQYNDKVFQRNRTITGGVDNSYNNSNTSLNVEKPKLSFDETDTLSKLGGVGDVAQQKENTEINLNFISGNVDASGNPISKEQQKTLYQDWETKGYGKLYERDGELVFSTNEKGKKEIAPLYNKSADTEIKEPEEEANPYTDFLDELSLYKAVPTDEERVQMTDEAYRNEYLLNTKAAYWAQQNGTTFQEEYDKLNVGANLNNQDKANLALNLLNVFEEGIDREDASEEDIINEKKYYEQIKNNPELLADFGDYIAKSELNDPTFIKERSFTYQKNRKATIDEYIQSRFDKEQATLKFAENAIKSSESKLNKYQKENNATAYNSELAQYNKYQETYNSASQRLTQIKDNSDAIQPIFGKVNKDNLTKENFNIKVENKDVLANTLNIAGQIPLVIGQKITSLIGGAGRIANAVIGSENLKDALDEMATTEISIGGIKSAGVANRVEYFKDAKGNNYKEINGTLYYYNNGKITRLKGNVDRSNLVSQSKDTEYNASGIINMTAGLVVDALLTKGTTGLLGRGAKYSTALSNSKKVTEVFGAGSQMAKGAAGLANIMKNPSSANLAYWFTQFSQDSYIAAKEGGIESEAGRNLYMVSQSIGLALISQINPDINILKSMGNSNRELVNALLRNDMTTAQKVFGTILDYGKKAGVNVAKEVPEEIFQQGFQDFSAFVVNSIADKNIKISEAQDYKEIAVGTIGSVALAALFGGKANVNIGGREINTSNLTQPEILTLLAREPKGIEQLKEAKSDAYFQSQRDMVDLLIDDVSTRKKYIDKIPDIQKYSPQVLSEVAPILQQIDKKKNDLKNDDGTFKSRIQSEIDDLTTQVNTILDNDLNPSTNNAETAQSTPQPETVQEQTTTTDDEPEQPSVQQTIPIAPNQPNGGAGSGVADINNTDSQIDEINKRSQEVYFSDPDLKNIDPEILAARNGDTVAQQKFKEYGIDWEQTRTFRFVGQSEVDILLADKKVESKRGMADAGIDVTTSPKVTSAANSDYRVTFKESFDVNNGLSKVRAKNKEIGDHHLEKGRGYSLNDVSKIEKLDDNGNVVELVWTSENKPTINEEQQPETTTQPDTATTENVQDIPADVTEQNEDDIDISDLDVDALFAQLEENERIQTDNIGADGNAEPAINSVQQEEQGGQESTQAVSTTADIGASEGNVEVAGSNLSKFKKGDKVYNKYRDQVYEIIDDSKSIWKLLDSDGNISELNANNNGGFSLNNTVQQTPAFNDNEQAQTLNENQYEINGRVYTQSPDGSFTAEDKNGKQRKVTTAKTVSELTNLAQERNTVQELEKNGYTYRKMKDGTETITSPNGKVMNETTTRTVRRKGKKVIEKTSNANFRLAKATIFGDKTENQIRIEDKAKLQEAYNLFGEGGNETTVAMLYFAQGGKVSKKSVAEEILGQTKKESEKANDLGKTYLKSEEMKSYTWATLGKNADKSFEEIAHKIWNDNPRLDIQEIRDQLIRVVSSYGNTADIQYEIVNLYEKTVDPYAGFTDEDAIAMQEAEASKAKMDFYNSVGDVYGLTDEELLDYYKQQYENSINNLTDEQQNELYTADTRTDSAQQADKNEGNGNSVSEKQSQERSQSEEVKFDNLSPEEINNMSLDELDKLWSDMENSGYSGGNYWIADKRLSQLEKDSVLQAPTLEDSKKALNYLLRKNEEMPNGYTSSFEDWDIKDALEAIEKYNESDLTIKRAINTFVKGITDEGATLYNLSNGINFRLNLQYLLNNGVTLKQLMNEYAAQFPEYDIDHVAELVEAKMKTFFGDVSSEIVQETASLPNKTTTSPEYQQLLKDREAQEARVKSAKEKLDRVNKTTNTDFQADQENIFGERPQAEGMFDERADGNAGRKVIEDAKSNYDAERNELARINKAIRDFESGNANGTGAIDFSSDTEAQPKTPTSTQKIEDFGEKIGGAKKDVYERLSEITTDDLESKPLSKSFPIPDFKKLVEDGVLTTEQAILLKFLYESIPAKPRKPYLIKTWAQKVKYVIDTYNELFSGSNIDVVGRIRESSVLGEQFKMYEEIHNEFGFPANPANMGGYEIKRFTNAGGSYYAVVKGSYIKSRDLYSVKDAVNAVKSLVDKNKEEKNTIKFGIYQSRRTQKYFIGKKGANDTINLVEFETLPEAREFLKNNQEQLENMWNAMKITQSERRDFNRARKGQDHRNGKNVTPEEFGNKFGFRGVEFGNWVNNDERQGSLNDAYDAFMDLALALGVQPRALSLNGELALAFGARGSGGKNPPSAHYEPVKVVINLTKKNGAGSLAHEWWHGLDNYFERTRGRKDNFLTDSPRVRINRDGTQQTEVRPAVIEAFKNIVSTIEKSDLNKRSKEADKARSKPYFGTPIEMSARAFENFVAEKLAESGIENDYLVNFKEQEEWLRGGSIDVSNYPYPTKEESADLNKAYQDLFNTVEQKKEGDNIALFQIANKPFTPIPQSTYDKLVKRLLSVFKKFGGKVITTKAEVDAKLKEFGVADYMIKGQDESKGIQLTYDSDGFHLAPNGERSKLTEAQAKLVRTTSFKNWFGDWENDAENASKVVDENGEPMVVYHGSGKRFNEFLRGDENIDKGIYFTNNKYFALDVFALQPELVNREKNNDFTDEFDKKVEDDLIEDSDFKYSRLYSVFLNIKNPSYFDSIDAKLIPTTYNNINDGIIALNTGDFGYKGSQIVAFSPNQIKSATDNNGEFDSDNPNINYLKTKDGEIYGAKFPDGTIYLNPEKVNANTPIHEFSHLWQQLMPARFKNGVELLKNTPIGKRTFAELKANEGYANKSDEELWDEALVTVMGNEGERIFNSPRTSKFKEWLVDLFKKLGDVFGIRELSPDDKLSTFVKGALSEVMGTKEIIPESSVEQKEVPIYIKKMSNTDLRTMLDKLGLIADAVCP